jgi:hypothetical protein
LAGGIVVVLAALLVGALALQASASGPPSGAVNADGAAAADVAAAAAVGDSATTIDGAVPTVASFKASQVTHLPSAAACVTRVRVVLTAPSGVSLRKLELTIGSRHVLRRPAPRSLDVGGLPAKPFTLTATVTTSAGARMSRSRRYHRCRP